MSNPLSEHDATLRARRLQHPKPDPAAKSSLEPVEGGRVRRIVFPGEVEPVKPRFEDGSEPAGAHADSEPIAESAVTTMKHESWHEDGGRTHVERETVRSEPRVPAPEVRRGDHEGHERYHPRHHATMDEIEADVDRILGRPRPKRVVTHEREEALRSERTVYKTERGAVRSSEVPTPEGPRRALYISKKEGGAERERRFLVSEVDRLVANVPLEEETVVEETVTEDVVIPPAPRIRGKSSAKATAPPKVVEAPKKKAPAATKAAAEAYYGFKGKSLPVQELEGIGPTYGKRLEDLGIQTTDRLLYEDAATLAKQLGTPSKTVASWMAMAELVKINGVGPQYAEALARAGVTGIQELKTRAASAIADQVNEYLDSLDTNVLGSGITERRVAGWQAKAKKMRRVRMKVPES